MADIDPERLRRVTVFSTCTPGQLRRLADTATVTEHAAGDALTEEGVLGHRFHLLLGGAAEVTRGGSPVGMVASGGFVGEVGLLGGGPSTATVRCTAPTTCLTLDRQPFWEILEAEPAIALRILEVVCRRLEDEYRSQGIVGDSATPPS
jgi:CRP/FNR family transcriptional regulator, cyclic AMP receptor protein